MTYLMKKKISECGKNFKIEGPRVKGPKEGLYRFLGWPIDISDNVTEVLSCRCALRQLSQFGNDLLVGARVEEDLKKSLLEYAS
jgi:hypothetical protein